MNSENNIADAGNVYESWCIIQTKRIILPGKQGRRHHPKFSNNSSSLYLRRFSSTSNLWMGNKCTSICCLASQSCSSGGNKLIQSWRLICRYQVPVSLWRKPFHSSSYGQGNVLPGFAEHHRGVFPKLQVQVWKQGRTEVDRIRRMFLGHQESSSPLKVTWSVWDKIKMTTWWRQKHRSTVWDFGMVCR